MKRILTALVVKFKFNLIVFWNKYSIFHSFSDNISMFKIQDRKTRLARAYYNYDNIREQNNLEYLNCKLLENGGRLYCMLYNRERNLYK